MDLDQDFNLDYHNETAAATVATVTAIPNPATLDASFLHSSFVLAIACERQPDFPADTQPASLVASDVNALIQGYDDVGEQQQQPAQQQGQQPNQQPQPAQQPAPQPAQ